MKYIFLCSPINWSEEQTTFGRPVFLFQSGTSLKLTHNICWRLVINSSTLFSVQKWMIQFPIYPICPLKTSHESFDVKAAQIQVYLEETGTAPLPGLRVRAVGCIPHTRFSAQGEEMEEKGGEKRGLLAIVSKGREENRRKQERSFGLAVVNQFQESGEHKQVLLEPGSGDRWQTRNICGHQTHRALRVAGTGRSAWPAPGALCRTLQSCTVVTGRVFPTLCLLRWLDEASCGDTQFMRLPG